MSEAFDFGNHLNKKPTMTRSQVLDKAEQDKPSTLTNIIDSDEYLENFVRQAGPFKARRKGTSQFWFLETVDGSELPKGLGGLWTDAASLLGAVKKHLELEAQKSKSSSYQKQQSKK